MTREFVNQKLTAAYERLQLTDPERENLTVAVAFQASYDQLNPDLQRYWRSLAIFPADFNAKAADAVWRTEDAPAALTQALSVFDRLLTSTSAPKPPDAWEVLSELQTACLVDHTTGRWRLHDLARDFTRTLCAAAEIDALAYRHAAYYVNVLAEAKHLYLKGGEQALAGLALFDHERTNIEAGQAWAAAHPADPAAARLCNLYPDAGTYVIGLRLHPRAQIAWLEAALTAAQKLGNRQYEGHHLGNLGLAWAAISEPRRAMEYHEKHLVITREIGDRRGEGAALNNLGNSWAALDESRRAIGYYEQALAIDREIGDRRSEGNTLNNLGLAWADLDEPRRAIDYYEQRLSIAREIGDRRGEGKSLGNLGLACTTLNEPHRAISYLEQGLVIIREIGDQRSEGSILGGLGIAYQNLGELEKASGYYEQQMTLARAIGDRQGEANACWNLGLLLEGQGELPRAVELMQICVDYERYIGHPNADKDAARVEQIRQKLK